MTFDSDALNVIANALTYIRKEIEKIEDVIERETINYTEMPRDNIIRVLDMLSLAVYVSDSYIEDFHNAFSYRRRDDIKWYPKVYEFKNRSIKEFPSKVCYKWYGSSDMKALAAFENEFNELTRRLLVSTQYRDAYIREKRQEEAMEEMGIHGTILEDISLKEMINLKGLGYLLIFCDENSRACYRRIIMRLINHMREAM